MTSPNRRQVVDPVDDLMEANGKRRLAEMVVGHRNALEQIANQSPYTDDDWARIGRYCVNVAAESLRAGP